MLEDGVSHAVDSSEIAFRLAAVGAMRQGGWGHKARWGGESVSGGGAVGSAMVTRGRGFTYGKCKGHKREGLHLWEVQGSQEGGLHLWEVQGSQEGGLHLWEVQGSQEGGASLVKLLSALYSLPKWPAYHP